MIAIRSANCRIAWSQSSGEAYATISTKVAASATHARVFCMRTTSGKWIRRWAPGGKTRRARARAVRASG